jgi:hypothetical protein
MSDFALQISFLVAVLVLVVGSTTRAGGRWGGQPVKLLLGGVAFALLIVIASLAIEHFR